MGHLEIAMGVAATAGVGRSGQGLFRGRVMQCIVEPRDRARRVAEGRVGGDVLDPLAIDIDLAALAQALEIFRSREGPVPVGADIFRSHAFLPLAAVSKRSICGMVAPGFGSSKRRTARSRETPGGCETSNATYSTHRIW